MYTGTLINDLVATVERVEWGAHRKQLIEALEPQHICELQLPHMDSQPAFAGAA